MTRRISVSGYAMKDGKLVKSVKRMDVSKRIRIKNSKKVRVVRRGKA